MKDGIYYDMSFDAYAADPGLNASKLKAARKSMKHLKHYIDDQKPATPCMVKGRNVHSATLEPELFAETIAVYDGHGTRATLEYKSFKASADAAGLTVLKQSECDELQAIKDSVWAEPLAREIIENTRHEVSLFWTDKILGPCKIRLDWLSDDKMRYGDLKSSAAVDPWSFCAVQYRMGTHLQLAWGRFALDTLCGTALRRCEVIAVEQGAPYDCAVYEVSRDVLEHGWKEADELARRVRIAQSTDNYPGVSGGELLELALPGWVGKKDETWEVGS